MRACSRCKVEKADSEFQPSEKYRCRECMKKKDRLYKATHRDQVKAYQDAYNKTDAAKASRRRYYENGGKKKRQAWAEANRDKDRAKHRKYYLANTEARYASGKKWREKNPEAWRGIKKVNDQKRRARKIGAGVFYVSPKEIKGLYEQPCAECGCTSDQNIDHIIPLARGGRHSIGNLQTLCKRCNFSKKSQLTVEWRARKRLASAA